MLVKFQKYQGTGNDFILIDNRSYGLKRERAIIEKLCNRRFGVGADGLIFLQEKKDFDFEMVYFNSDGNESSMCGNGGRCIIQFAHAFGLISTHTKFLAIDGEHEGEILTDGNVSLKMKNVDVIRMLDRYSLVMNTGSPHFVKFVDEVEKMNVVEEGRKIRYSGEFKKEGINVNFVEKKSDSEIFVRTYERGVEDETLSCGTGVVASSLATAYYSLQNINEISVQTPGGKLKVKFDKVSFGFENILLIGPAVKVFEGEVDV